MVYTVTTREREVLVGISKGLTTREIANSLFLSDHTIITYRKNLFSKLEVPNAPSLVRRGFELGLLKLADC